MPLDVIIKPTKVDGCLLLESRTFRDARGEFFECWNEKEFEKYGLPTEWPQDNISTSYKRVLRGLHIQGENPQGKLVRCLSGVIWDVCLDLRPSSPTYLQWTSELIHGNKALYCPPGTAHGFLAMEENTAVYYKCTTLYDRNSDGGVNPLDSELGIPWPENDPIISAKDKALPYLADYKKGAR